MSRPNSFCPPPPGASRPASPCRTPSPTPSSPPLPPGWTTLISLDNEEQEQDTAPSAISPLRAGFSLSGETELKIALAKSSTTTTPAAAEDAFRFREMPLLRAAERKMAGNSVGGKVKKLGKGIRELVCGAG
jgi:hypothetical protein